MENEPSNDYELLISKVFSSLSTLSTSDYNTQFKLRMIESHLSEL